MNGFLHRHWVQAQPVIQRYFWIFVGYSISQIGVQLLNFCTGFAIIRNLSKEQYAMYTVINTLVPAMLVVSDSGIVSSIMALGGKFWQDNDRMGSLINTGLQLRRKLALYSMLVIGPLLIWMLFHLNTPTLTVGLLVAAVLIGISFQLTSYILRTVLELRQHVKALSKVNLAAAALRLAIVAALVAFYHLSAFLATVAATCTFILEASYLIHTVKPQIKWEAAPSPEYRSEMVSMVRRALPLSIYFCIQGQVSVWLIGIFGSAHQVADIGAAMRLNVIFTTLTSAFCLLMLPRFSRTSGRQQLHRQVYEILGGLVLLLAGLVTFAALFPQPFVLLLGDKYANMSGLFWLVIFASGLGSVIGTLFTLNMSKGWVPPAHLSIPIEILSQIILLLVLDLSKTTDVLVFALLSGVAPGIFLFVLLLRNIAREPQAASA